MRTIYLSIFICALISSCEIHTQADDVASIKAVMMDQQKAWSDYDIDAFMEGYWNSDSLKFYGSSGLTHGWKNTLENYKKRYPTKEDTGSLEFTFDNISQINEDAYYVMGQYHLSRERGDANGIFMIIFKRINGKWKIISDLTC